MRDLEGPLLLVGCGKMGSAMLAGWLDRGLDPIETHVIEPNRAVLGSLAELGVCHHAEGGALPQRLQPRVVVLAVKPQMMDAALPHYRRFVGPGTLFLSIAAGKTIAYFERGLGEAAIVRAMPNTPAAIGRGITVACANGRVSADQRELADQLLKAVGEVAWVEDESLIDPVTALSGGGPAYVFLLIEYLAEAGVAAGLPPDLAKRLARVTVSGAGELARQSQEPVEQLRQNVTSPGGTTLEALKILMAEDGLKPLLVKAIAAATRRSRELAS
ncbi:MAG: pyrroline-5-carboxylate reductase [Pseudomonadota bacterium]